MVTFINHNKKEANAKIRWSTSSIYHDNEWIHRSKEELVSNKENSKPRLGLDFVATRDIRPGEEVYIDYGDAWEQAWERHVQEWRSPLEAYISARDLNVENPPIIVKTIPEERLLGPYPKNVYLGCFYDFSTAKDEHSGEQTRQMFDDFVNASAISDLEVEVWDTLAYTWIETPRTYSIRQNLHECQVLVRDERKRNASTTSSAQHLYKVLVIHVNGNDERLVKLVPRESIVFLDRPYTSEEHLPNAFRHEIGIPDEIFPTSWND
eukprot:scaffold222682_cov45-Attheya_sp.AAC.1